MALGEIKGMSLTFPDEKYLFFQELANKDFIESYGPHGNFGFWIKVKNPHISYDWQFSGLRVPVVDSFKKADEHYDGAIFTIPVTRKYFHDVLENMPQILSLKEQGQKFKVLLSTHENLNNDGVFSSFVIESKDVIPGKTEVSLKYWTDFLEYFDIDYECVTSGWNKRISADYAYLFYYTDHGLGINRSDSIHNTTGLSGVKIRVHGIAPELSFSHSYQMVPFFYFTNLICADAYEILKRNFKPLIKDTVPNKKIFISRDSVRFEDRSILNSDRLTKYMIAKGFDVVSQEDLSMMDQISYITEAECVAALVGSGFINPMFCNPETQLLIIHTDKSQDFGIYVNQAARYKMDAKLIYADPDGDDIINYFETSNNHTVNKWVHGNI